MFFSVLFSCAQTAGYLHAKVWSWTPTSHHTQKIYSKWITDQSVKTTGIKFFEKTQEYLQDHGLSNDFLDMTAKTSNKKK